MIHALILLAPLILLVIVLLFGFTGCASFAEADDWPPPKDQPPDQPPDTPQPKPVDPYNKAIEATDGFLALWPMNETTGPVANATSGLATLINIDGAYKPGATPGSEGAFFHKEPGANFAPTLDGASGYIEVPYNEQLNATMNPLGFSVELWAKPADAIPVDVEQILISSHHISSGNNERGYEIALVGTAAGHATVRARVFNVNTGPTSVDVTPTAGDPLAWRHIVLTYNPPVTTLRLCVNVTSTSFDTIAHQAAGDYSPVQTGGGERPLRFGAGHLKTGGPEKFFAGRIDEVAFYQLVLLPAIVKDHFELF